MTQQGTDRIFFAGTPLTECSAGSANATAPRKTSAAPSARPRARRTSHRSRRRRFRPVADPLSEALRRPRKTCRVVGITGPGGAGKTTLIDELVLRFLRTRPAAGAHGDPLARPEHRRHGRGRAPGRPRDDDLFAKRPRVHALDGDARAVRRTQPIDGSVPRTPRGVAASSSWSSSRPSARARKRCRFRATSWTCESS